ncbi:MAG TPA: 4-carboxy-4-hydroxy-2-oxoadipate aldolase/oxaloacetate decarboxylase, partial [Nitrospinae bacterium]|nr:4-carboxy-4-hydroxy-2-oxoadipate aldolase/oxaloacetate decarboxylase [Nitrospinota bacterium]
MSGVVVRNFKRPDSAIIESLGKSGVATVHEAQGRKGLMAPYMNPIYPGAATSGPAVTVLSAPGDNWMLHVVVEVCQPGDVVVMAATSGNTDGYFGELLATSMALKGVRGLFIDAGCRDVRELSEMKFPVWSKAVSAQGTVKETVGSVNIPIVCAGQHVRPGDIVIGDDDGVVIVPSQEAEQ